MSDIETDKVVVSYIKIRDARALLKKEYEDKDEKLQDQLDALESHLLSTVNASGGTGIKCASGTVTKTTKTRYFSADWQSMHEFVLEHKVPELLENRISQTNMAEFLKNNPDLLPKGLNVESKYSIVVRRASK